jgi:predicted regulator of Ras-like GTPase activity (Roadblock/LC7/MglB family)
MTNYTHHISGGIKIHPDQMISINDLLTDLIRRVPASFTMIIDKAGQCIVSSGEIGGANLVTLSALIAGDLAASQEIARLTGEYGNYQLVLREGDRTNALISEAGPHLVLFVQARSEVPLGWARILIRDAARSLEELIATPTKETKPLGMEIGFENLRDRFSRALEDLWSE